MKVEKFASHPVIIFLNKFHQHYINIDPVTKSNVSNLKKEINTTENGFPLLCKPLTKSIYHDSYKTPLRLNSNPISRRQKNGDKLFVFRNRYLWIKKKWVFASNEKSSHRLIDEVMCTSLKIIIIHTFSSKMILKVNVKGSYS